MAQDQREYQKPVPDNFAELVSLEQLATISELESLGW
jgi:hypothetical protein